MEQAKTSAGFKNNVVMQIHKQSQTNTAYFLGSKNQLLLIE
jgi:hypothetical protein